MKVAPEVGQIWVAQPHGLSPAALTAGLFSWKRFVRIEAVDVKHDKIRIRTVEKHNDDWIDGGKKTTARLSRFDGSYWNYAFVENPKPRAEAA